MRFPKRRNRHEKENRTVGFGGESDGQSDGAGRKVDGHSSNADARRLGGGI